MVNKTRSDAAKKGWEKRRRAAAAEKEVKLNDSPAKHRYPKINTFSFDAASHNRILHSLGITTDIRDDIRNDLSNLQQRAGELAKNNPHVKRYLAVLRDNVIGPNGIKLQARVADDDGTVDNLANQLIESGWKKWGKNPSLQGLSWVQLQWLLICRLAVDGELFVQLVVSDDDESLKLNVIPAANLDPSFDGKNSQTGNQIRSSVEVDEFRRPVAYWVSPDSTRNNSLRQLTPTQRKVTRIPAEDMIHVFVREDPAQLRGIPMLAPAMEDLHLLKKYTQTELVAAVVGAGKAYFFTSKTGEDWLAIGPEDANMDVNLDINPGDYNQLPPGMELTETDPKHPNTAFSDFEDAILYRIAAGLNIPFASLSGKTTRENFSSLRATQMEQRYAYRTLQQFLVDCFYKPVYNRWLLLELSRKSLKLPTTSPLPLAKIEKFERVDFIPRGFKAVQEERQIPSDILAIKNNLKSLTQVVAESGGNLEDVLRDRQREKALAESLGLTDIAALDDAQVRSILENIEDEE